MGRLTTHVLDTALGRPAAGLHLALVSLAPERCILVTATTNPDGRVDAPLLEGETMRAGPYELVFEAAAYHRQTGQALADPPFLDEVVIRFAIADPAAHYHVPLLLSPWSYTTYRGS
ncbi:MAG: hydroxyisourate hydrolase [Geminicoccaceae bacterium]|nr:MAG: hydroxyisourate hydrolase [Geminicoccaceae bacterium]